VFTPSLAEPQAQRALAPLRKLREILAQANDTSAVGLELSRLAAEAQGDLDTDARLAASIQRAGNVFLAVRPSSAAALAAPLPSFAERVTVASAQALQSPAVQGGDYPLAAFGAVAAGVGHLRITAEDDGVARRMSLLVRHGATTLPS